MKFRSSICALFSLAVAGLASAEQSVPQTFPSSFYVEGLDIEVSQVEMGFEGPYPVNGVAIKVNRGDDVILEDTHEISGELRRAWVTDLDRDRNPEIIVWSRIHGSGGYGEYKLLEVEGTEVRSADFPQLSDSQREGYSGHDELTTSPSNIIRKFQKYLPGDPNCCPSGPVTEITYGFRDGEVLIERTREL